MRRGGLDTGRHAAAAHAADGEDPLPYRLHQEQWVCRDTAAGTERWRADGTGRVVAGVLGSMLVAVDVSAGERERLQADLRQAEVAPVTADSSVLALDAATGQDGWITRVPGQVGSMACGPHGISAVSNTADGTAGLHHLDHNGLIRFAHRLGSVSPVLLAGNLEDGVAALEQDRSGASLVMYPWDRAEPAWRVPVQPPVIAFAPRIADARRLDTVPGLAAGNRCYLRSQHALHVVEC